MNAILESPSVIVQKDLRTSIEERLSEYNYTDFEKIIVKILADIYKGESLVTRASKDGGIDGIIRFQQGFNEQLLIVQVKKHKETTVGVEKIRAFSAVVDKYQENISKIGIFFTTSTFSLDAKKFVSNQAGNMSIVTTDNLITQMIIGRVGILDNSGTLILNEDYYNLI